MCIRDRDKLPFGKLAVRHGLQLVHRCGGKLAHILVHVGPVSYTHLFSIYQLKRGDETRDLRFEPYDRLQAAGLTIDRVNYELVYTCLLYTSRCV